MKLPDRATSTTTAERIAELCRAELLGDAAVVLRASPGATSSITDAQRAALLAACAAGEYVELTVEFKAYEQRAGERNRNNVRFADKAVAKLARSAKGIPLLRDHDSYDTRSRAGTVLEAVHEQDGDQHTIRMTAKVTAPWAVEALLRGLIDRFSIHAVPTGPVLCSACGTAVGEPCWHFPGDRLSEVTDGDGKRTLQRSRTGSIVVEWIFTAAELVETSAVSVPAVPSARIETVRAAVLAARGINATDLDELEAAPEDTRMTTIALALMTSALGLPSTSTADQVEAAARSQTARLSTLEAANVELTRQLGAANVQLAAVREATAAAELEQFITAAVGEGKVIPGGPTEVSLRTYFKADPAGARALIATLPRVTPAGAARMSLTPPATPPAGAGTGAGPGPGPDPAATQLAAVEAEITAQGARPAAVLGVLSQFGGDAAAKLAKYGPAAFGLAPAPGAGR